MYTFTDGTLQPCEARHDRVHGPFTAYSRHFFGRVYDGRYTAVRQVHTSTPQLKGRLRAMHTSMYTASTQSCTRQVGLHGTLRAMYMDVYMARTWPFNCGVDVCTCRTAVQRPSYTAVYTGVSGL